MYATVRQHVWPIECTDGSRQDAQLGQQRYRQLKETGAADSAIDVAGEGLGRLTVESSFTAARIGLHIETEIGNPAVIDKITYTPIGVVHSPFTDVRGMPIQPSSAASARGSAEIFPDYREGLKDLEGFSHLVLLYHFHRVERVDLIVTPFLDRTAHGVFATRAPTRPNPIGLSVVQVTGIRDGVIHLENVDILDGTPLLDIKPFVPDFDQPDSPRTGWLATAKGKVKDQKSDARFGE